MSSWSYYKVESLRIFHTMPVDQLALGRIVQAIVEVVSRHKVDATQVLGRTTVLVKGAFDWQQGEHRHSWSRIRTYHLPFGAPRYHIDAKTVLAAIEAVTDLLWQVTSLRNTLARNELYIDVEQHLLAEERLAKARTSPALSPVFRPENSSSPQHV